MFAECCILTSQSDQTMPMNLRLVHRSGRYAFSRCGSSICYWVNSVLLSHIFVITYLPDMFFVPFILTASISTQDSEAVQSTSIRTWLIGKDKVW